ncbi:MAG: hypothetical protein AAF485_20405 [Chloroflexota bacterium]
MANEEHFHFSKPACDGIGSRFSPAAHHYLPNDKGGPLWVVVGTYDLHLMKNEGACKIDQLRFNLKFMDGNTDLPGLAQEKASN